MAVNERRSCNADLREGMTDGTYKKRVVNRGGDLDPHTDRRYGFPENLRIEDHGGSASDIVPEFRKMRAGAYMEDLS